MRTLQLTSPFMHGKDVTAAQTELARAKFLRMSSVDGQYGPETARAAQQAHWLLGFGGRLARSTAYGPTLAAVLKNWNESHHLPPEYEKRRKARLAASVGKKALEWLRGHVGDTEHPAGSNRVDWASEWYGIIGPWCAMGATRARVEAGSKHFKRGVNYASVPILVGDALAGRNGLSRTYAPTQGDLVAFDWNGDGLFDHVETIDVPPIHVFANAHFTTIGCNTSFDDAGDQSNGGACAHRNRTTAGGNRTIFIHELG